MHCTVYKHHISSLSLVLKLLIVQHFHLILVKAEVGQGESNLAVETRSSKTNQITI